MSLTQAARDHQPGGSGGAWLTNRTAAFNLRNLISHGLAFDNRAWVPA